MLDSEKDSEACGADEDGRKNDQGAVSEEDAPVRHRSFLEQPIEKLRDSIHIKTDNKGDSPRRLFR